MGGLLFVLLNMVRETPFRGYAIPAGLMLLVCVVIGAFGGCANAFVLLLLSKLARRKLRDRTTAWETEVEKRVRVRLPYEKVFEHVGPLLSSIRAKLLTCDEDEGTVVARRGFGGGEKVTMGLRRVGDSETEVLVASAPLTRAPERSVVVSDDFGRNAWNVQRLCDRLAALGEAAGASTS